VREAGARCLPACKPPGLHCTPRGGLVLALPREGRPQTASNLQDRFTTFAGLPARVHGRLRGRPDRGGPPRGPGREQGRRDGPERPRPRDDHRLLGPGQLPRPRARAQGVHRLVRGGPQAGARPLRRGNGGPQRRPQRPGGARPGRALAAPGRQQRRGVQREPRPAARAAARLPRGAHRARGRRGSPRRAAGGPGEQGPRGPARVAAPGAAAADAAARIAASPRRPQASLDAGFDYAPTCASSPCGTPEGQPGSARHRLLPALRRDEPRGGAQAHAQAEGGAAPDRDRAARAPT
jgi:hypothetical protein